MKNILSVSIALAALILPASAEPVLAKILEASGSVQATNASGAIKAGATLPPGASITTGPASKITFNAFPGSLVSVAAQTQATLVSMEVSRTEGVVSREATFKLDAGMVFFAVDKVNWDTTKFAVQTPNGTVQAKKPELPKTATAGIVEVKDGQLRIATQAGQMECASANGTGIAVPAGSVLSSSGQSFQVVDLTTGQTTAYDSAGAAGETHAATTAEVTSSTEEFSKGAVVIETLIASGAVSPDLSTAVRDTLMAVNQKLAQLGAEPVSTGQVGALPGASTTPATTTKPAASASQPLPSSFGSPGGSAANPANSSGPVRSPER